MSERYNLLINADRSLIEHSHGANYTTKFQEQVRKKLLNRCFLEIFLANPMRLFFRIDLTQFQDEIFEEFRKNKNRNLIEYSRIDWNKKDGQESDEYKNEILRLVEEEKIGSILDLGIDWNRKDGQESDEYKNEILRLVEAGKIWSLDYLGIDWNKKGGQESDEYKDEILRLVEEGKLKGIGGIGIDWNNENLQESDKDDILRLVEARNIDSLYNLRIDWNKKGIQESDEYKDRILKLVEEGKLKGIGDLGIDWNKRDGQESDEYKDRILKLVEEGKLRSMEDLGIDWNKRDGQESDEYKDRILKLVEEGKLKGIGGIGINWNRKDGHESNEYKDRILKLVEERKLNEIEGIEIDWNRKDGHESDEYKDEILRLVEVGVLDSLYKLEIDWNRRDGQESDYYLSEILELYVERYPDARESINFVQQSYNPLEEIGLYKQLFFESGPHWKFLSDETQRTEVSGENADTIKDNLESQSESKKRFLKSLLVGLYDMGTLQILAESENQKLKKLTGSQIDTYPEDESLKDVSFVDSLSSKELNVYLLFYINKMTKLNELTIYRRMLGSFTYDEELEAGLKRNNELIASAENNTSPTPSPEIQRLLEYKHEKQAAEDKADNLIAVFNELKAKYDDLVANNMSEKVGKKFPIYMESFTSFLQHYWEVKDNPDLKQVDGKSVNGQLLEFFELFNTKIDELQNDGIDVNEIKNLFVFSSRALSFQETLYRLKDNVVEQVIEYGKNNDDDFEVRYVDLNKEGKSKAGYAVFVYTPSIPFPISVHVNDISDFSIGRDKEVNNGSILNSFGEKVAMNFVNPVPMESGSLGQQLEQLNFKSLISNNQPISVFKYGYEVSRKYLGYRVANKRLLNPYEGKIDRDIEQCFIRMTGKMSNNKMEPNDFIKYVASIKMPSDPQIDFLNKAKSQDRDALQADYISYIEEREKADVNNAYKTRVKNIGISLWDCISDTIEVLKTNENVSPDDFDRFMQELQEDFDNLSPAIINGKKKRLFGEIKRLANTQGGSLRKYTKEEKEELANSYKDDLNGRYEGIKGDLAQKTKKDILVLINDMKRNGYISTYKYVEVMSLIQKNIDSPEAKNLTIDEINSKIGELQTLMSPGNVNANVNVSGNINGNTSGNPQKMTMEELAERLAGIYVGKEQIREEESNGEKTANSEKTSNDEKSSYLISVDDIAKWVLNLKQLPQQLYQKVKSIVFQAKRKLVMSLSKEEIKKILDEMDDEGK